MPERIPPSAPMVSFMVQDIERAEALKRRGATFQSLGQGSFAGREGVPQGEVMDFGPVKSAFLKDSEGNVLALNGILEWVPPSP